jgi:hypothetical protein
MNGKKEEEKRIGMNVSSVIRLIGAVIILSILLVSVHALMPSQVFDKVMDLIVVVKVLDVQGYVKGVGCWVLTSCVIVATNCHVVEEGFAIMHPSSQSSKLHPYFVVNI